MSKFLDNHRRWVNRSIARKKYYVARRKEKMEKGLHEALLSPEQRELERIQKEQGIRDGLIQKRKETV